jgi:WD40 repeat protein
MSVDSLTKLQYNKLIPIKYSTNGEVVRESLVSFHELDGTFSSLEFHEGSTSVISEPLADLGSLRSTSSTVSALACSCDGQRVAVGYKDGSTRIYSFTADSLMLSSETSSLHPFFTLGEVIDTDDDDNDEVTFVAGPRFQSCVRDLAFDPRSSAESGYFLALASEDYTCGVCVVNVSSDMSERYLLDCSSRYGGVRSLAYTPTVENDTVLLVALGMDGKVTFYTCMGLDQPDVYWDVLHHETTPAIPLKDIGEVITHTDSGASTPHDSTAVALFSKATLPVWSSDGSILAIPGSFDVQLRLREDVTKKYYLFSSATRKEGHYLGEIVTCTMYQELLVSLGRDGTACLWKLDQDTVKRLLQDPSLRNTTTSLGHFQKAINAGTYPTSIIFLSHISQLHNAVCIQSATGECQLHTNLLTTVAAATSEESSIQQDTRKKNKSKILEENESDQESIHFDTQPIRKPNFYVDDAAKEDDDEVENLALNEAHSTTGTVLSDGVATQEYNDDFPHEVDDDDHLEFREDNVEPSNNIYYSYPKPQEAFAPSSTPLHHDAIDARRILCWNHVGVATSRNDSMRGGKIIDINFTDVLSGGGFKTFSDTYGFEIGSLSEEGGIFATYPEDSDTGSRIYYFRFETIGLQNKKDWTMILPNGEGVLGCACGEGWAAVVTK